MDPSYADGPAPYISTGYVAQPLKLFATARSGHVRRGLPWPQRCCRRFPATYRWSRVPGTKEEVLMAVGSENGTIDVGSNEFNPIADRYAALMRAAKNVCGLVP